MFIKPTLVFFEEVSYFSDNAVRDSKDFGSTGQWFYSLAKKNGNYPNRTKYWFYSCNYWRKKGLIKILFIKQKQLATLTINYLNPFSKLLI